MLHDLQSTRKIYSTIVYYKCYKTQHALINNNIVKYNKIIITNKYFANYFN